ncbi:DUF1192 domain-containing protein [Ponticaulis sp.]|uniref:DUF1192 domain-containing protein n=1 Tax=Ponticaulis sp. TaxID=2020902 RepID=UPI000C6129B5|nr:DUF1192 domain-containing protein [Ponticaulis sp.]MAJ10581.1 hypothetical protein [Ponticaulis sp.]MDF1680286.1 DUF1192 domain-containing protein [Ponticaulis sp.]HBH90902.1 DUF1192 domain-containing protein [Hyphomonadaceae bacterium]HBJ94468.1 DUF1192 domain-containing protein [Hyphomonadaceae bacterium]|tara:strand:- start:18971 stop:19159 length:189 start_codon:yes stop_codon:yes gene_type:complete
MSDQEQAPDPKLLRDLEDMSVEDLQERIAQLKIEIAECEAEIVKKGNAKSAADAMFRFGDKS